MIYNRNILCLFATLVLLSCSTTHKAIKPEMLSSNRYEISSKYGADSAIIAIIKPYKDSLDKTMNTVIGTSAQMMFKDFPEGLLGNFVADLMLESVKRYPGQKADFSLVNNGGLRTNLPKGNISIRNIYELMPFDNEVVLVELRGSTVYKLLKSIAKGSEMAVSGLTLTAKNSLPVEANIQGKTIDTASKYLLVTSDYLAMGGSDLDFMKEALKIEKLNVKVRDMIIDYISFQTKNNQLLDSKTDGRIKFLK